jgi:hypothetical protein
MAVGEASFHYIFCSSALVFATVYLRLRSMFIVGRLRATREGRFGQTCVLAVQDMGQSERVATQAWGVYQKS